MRISQCRLLSCSWCVCLFAIAGMSLSAGAQTTAPNEWTWMGGSDTANQPGVYGSLGTPAAGNIPSSRIMPATATDSQGNLWLFGGSGSSDVLLNDLWEFNPSTNQWAWVNGSNTGTAPGNWGVLGSPAATNIPSPRSSAAAWIDSNGNFWLFGGDGLDSNNKAGILNDLWEYKPSTKQWTWMAGGNSLVCEVNPGYSTFCYEPAIGSNPGARDSEVRWTNSQGNLWLFGGNGADSSGTPGNFNDIWEYSTSTNSWTLMGGSSQITCVNWVGGFCVGSESSQPQYGALGVPASGNNPGGRTKAVGWTDSSGNLWIFGGENNIFTGPLMASSVYFNDVWKYDFYSGNWTWMAGTNGSIDASNGFNILPGVYGTLGVPASANTPGSRTNQNTWTDAAGNFWLFGGEVQISTGIAFLNDLWVFNPNSLNWTWMGGSTTPGSVCPNGYCGQPSNYGALGIAAAGNTPGGRAFAGGSTDSAGNFWLFGGGNPWMLIPYNDLWEYQPSANSLPPGITPAFDPPAGAYTSAQAVTISNGMSNVSIYYTTNGSTPDSGSTLYAGPVSVSVTETLKAIAITSGYPNSAMATAAYSIETPAATPTFGPAPGTYATAQSVTIGDTTPNATIYYTTDGVTTPTTASTPYTGAIAVASTETIQAIAVASGFSTSAVASATYTITPGFTITGAPVTVTAGATSGNTSTTTLTPVGRFTGKVALTAVITSGPSGGVQPTLSFGSTTPASITGSAAGTATLTITTTASSTTQCTSENRGRQGIPWYSGGGAVLACVLLFGIPSRRRSWLRMLGVSLLLVALAGGAIACSGGGGGKTCNPSPISGTTPGAYTITVTGTSGSTTSTGTVNLTVQ